MSNTTTTKVLTVADAVTLGTVLGWAIGTKRVKWLNNHDDLLDGVARCVGDANGNRLPADVDVRDGYLRISSTFEFFIPMGEVLRMVDEGRMVVDQ